MVCDEVPATAISSSSNVGPKRISTLARPLYLGSFIRGAGRPALIGSPWRSYCCCFVFFNGPTNSFFFGHLKWYALLSKLQLWFYAFVSVPCGSVCVVHSSHVLYKSQPNQWWLSITLLISTYIYRIRKLFKENLTLAKPATKMNRMCYLRLETNFAGFKLFLLCFKVVTHVRGAF